MANNRPSLPACTPSGKMVAYGKGVAPTLNYQVPQKTSFTTYGDIGLNLQPVFSKSMHVQFQKKYCNTTE